MSKILTIVIPTYNMEKYLHGCLNSLILRDELMDLLEIIIINDGSRDSSSQIAHEYEKKYPHTFLVIDKENGNYGSCVNVGLEKSKGKYFRILDADDWFNNEQFGVFLNTLKDINADVIITNYTLHRQGKQPKTIAIEELFPQKTYEINKCDFSSKRFREMLVMHSMTYKRDLLFSISYKQQEGISYTDIEYCYFPFSKARNMIRLNIDLYQYRIGREGQTMQSGNMVKNIDHFYMVANRILEDYLENTEALHDRQTALIYIMSNPIYQIYLINLILMRKTQAHHWEVMLKTERMVKHSKDLYNFVCSYTYKKIPFVRIWHKLGVRFAFLFGE